MEKTDIPFIEHAKFFPYCPYIRYVKGHVFTRDHRPEYLTQINFHFPNQKHTRTHTHF